MQAASMRKKTPVTLLALSIGFALQVQVMSAVAQEAAPAAQGDPQTLDTMVVTGYRASVERALDIKRGEKGVVDAIVAEDIGKFPDLNLAESLQRIPGVVISRDAGEGRNITVRGLGPDFTRVRLNGLEALSTVGSSDGQGGANRGRSFDFNVFAADLFSQLIVRKTASADVDEGSLGATVDLRTARPFDYDGFTVASSLQMGYNDAASAAAPRFAGLIANSWADGKVGALLSVAYSERETLEEGTGTVRWGPGNGNGGFSPDSPFQQALSPTVFAPRFPRYTLMEHDQERLGITGSLQFKPSDDTEISVDALYSKIDATRREKYIEANSLSKSSGYGSKPQIIVTDGVIENGALVYAEMDNVGLRSEHRYDEWDTVFRQLSVEGKHRFTDSFSVSGKLGASESKHDNPVQATIMMDQWGVNGYSYDYRGDPYSPVFDYGIDPTDPAGWNLSVIRMRQNFVTNDYKTGQLDFNWVLGPSFTLRGGVQGKDYSFESSETRRAGAETVVPDFNGGSSTTPVPMPADMYELAGLSGIDGSPDRWVVPDYDRLASLFDIYSNSGLFVMSNYAPSNRWVEEESRSAYLMGEFYADLGSVPLSGNFGARHVRTKQTSFGIGTTGEITYSREYNDTLPSMNLVAELTPDFLVRLAAAKVMSRPGLGSLTPGLTVSVSGSARTVSGGNPNLEPVRATNVDLGFEWYFSEGSMLGLGLFYKDLDSFIQTTRETRTFADSGLPASMIPAGSGATVNDEFVFTVPVNTPGGELTGFEFTYVQPFTFLPGFWQDFGAQLNYTYVDSEVQYMLSNGSLAQKEEMTGVSKTSWNATLFYEGDQFSGRVSATNRSDYLIQVPGTEVGFNSEAMGVHGQSGATYLDASIRWKLDDQIEISLEGSNLTNERMESWVANPAVQLPLESAQVGRQYMIGVRYRF